MKYFFLDLAIKSPLMGQQLDHGIPHLMPSAKCVLPELALLYEQTKTKGKLAPYPSSYFDLTCAILECVPSISTKRPFSLLDP